MRQFLFLLLAIIVGSFLQGCAYKVLKSDKFLEKAEMGKAKDRIDKAIKKDSDDPAAQFMLAKYYSHPVWSFDAVDSAHLYIRLVRDTFPKLEPKILEKLSKKGLDSVAIVEQALIVDSLAFEKAKTDNTEEAYNQYLQNYHYITFEEEATAFRNQVAYDNAIGQNTTQAVSDFFRKYPEAPQAQKARNVFETLYYEKKTQNQTLAEYIEYVEERPQTEFAEEASFEILSIISAGAVEKDYQQFINRYSQFRASKTAKTILEGLNYEKSSAELLTHKKAGSFYFYELEKQQLLSLQFKSVVPDSCFFVTEPFILSKQDNANYAYLKNGKRLVDFNIKAIEYLGSGFFQIDDYGRAQRLIHFSRNPELSQKASNFQVLDDFHLAKKEEDAWHLMSLLGEPILKQAVDSIWKEGEVFFFKKGNDMAVASRDDFKKSAKNELKSLSFLYDDYEWLSEEYLRLYSNDYETVLNQKAEVVFPLEKASFKFFDVVWIKEKDGKVTVLDKNRNSLFEEELADFQFESGILGLKREKLWSVYMSGIKGFPKFQYDSIRIFNSWLTYARQDDAEFLLFQSGEKVLLKENERYRILKNYNVAFTDVSDQIRFVEISNESGYFKVYNGFGRIVKEDEKLDINVLTPKLIQVHQNKKKQLIDSSGAEIKIKNVEAFGAYQDGLIPILQNRKFGALIVKDLKIIPANSQSKLEVFLRDSLYIFKEDNLLGISNAKAEIVVDADFESIEFSNDSTAIVEEEGRFGILNIYQNEYLVEDLDTWERVRFGAETFFIVRRQAGYGVINQLGQEVIPFIFNELKAYENKDELYWLAERRLSEINYIVIAYFDKVGKVLFKEGLNFNDFLETACD
jgi:hypothetical protein